MARIHTAHELAQTVASDPALQQQLKEDPVKTLNSLAQFPLQTDVWIYRLVVGTLGLVVLIAISSATGLAIAGKTEIPDVITALGSTSVGALAGLLAPAPAK